jgi:hypothetical protein
VRRDCGISRRDVCGVSVRGGCGISRRDGCGVSVRGGRGLSRRGGAQGADRCAREQRSDRRGPQWGPPHFGPSNVVV